MIGGWTNPLGKKMLSMSYPIGFWTCCHRFPRSMLHRFHRFSHYCRRRRQTLYHLQTREAEIPFGFVWKWLVPQKTQWFSWSDFPTKWLFHWGYTPFSDIPIYLEVDLICFLAGDILISVKSQRWDFANQISDSLKRFRYRRATEQNDFCVNVLRFSNGFWIMRRYVPIKKWKCPKVGLPPNQPKLDHFSIETLVTFDFSWLQWWFSVHLCYFTSPLPRHWVWTIFLWRRRRVHSWVTILQSSWE